MPKTITKDKETHGGASQTSLWSRQTNSRLSAFLDRVLFLPCDQSNRWNVTGNQRNISIYSRSGANRLKQLFGLQLSVCTNVTGRLGWGGGGGGHAEHPCLRLVELAQASRELCATKRRTCLCLVPGEQSGRVWTESVPGLVLAHQECLRLRHSVKSAAEGQSTPVDLAGEVGAGASNYSAGPVKQEQAILIQIVRCVREAELRRAPKLEVEDWCWCWWENGGEEKSRKQWLNELEREIR